MVIRNKSKLKFANMFFVLGCVISLMMSSVESKGATLNEVHPGSDTLSWVDYDNTKRYAEYSVGGARTRQNFGLALGDANIPKYFKVEVTTDSDIPSPIFCFASTDDNCFNARQQMTKNINEKTVTLWIKREEFGSDDLFVVVECTNDADKSCDYTLKFYGMDYMTFGPNFVYSYYVGAGNRDQILDVDREQNATAVTFFVVGSARASIRLESISSSPYKFKTGIAVTFKPPEEENKSVYSLTISADTGDYVTIGGISFKGNKATENLLQPNGEDISGYLVKEILEDQCFEASLLGESKYSSVSTIYITGQFYDHIAEVYLRDQTFTEIPNSNTTVTDGLYSLAHSHNGKTLYVCVRFPKNERIVITKIPFTLTISEPTTLKNSLLYYFPPQLSGRIYRRFIPKNGIAFFYSGAVTLGSKKVDYNVYSRKGFAKMYFTECQNFPNCKYEDSALNKLKIPKSTNRMTTYSSLVEVKDTPLSPVKNVIVVKCLDDDPQYVGYCEFETSVTTSKDEIELVEGEQFSGYALKADKGQFSFGVGGDNTIRRINIEVMVLSGDINFSLKDTGINHHKYYLANKMYFLIIAEDNDELSNIVIEYTASLNSFYTIQVTVNRRSDGGTQYVDFVNSGQSFLVQIDPTNTYKVKTVRIPNLRAKDKAPFLANFYALNCQFSVKRANEDISFYDGYAEEVIQSNDGQYNDPTYNYVITITEPDLSNYNHKMCMIFVAGVEQSTSTIDREIMVGENIGQQMIFENGITKIKFAYPHADPLKDLVLYINVIDLSNYRVNLYANADKIMTIDCSRSQIVHIPTNKFDKYCAENTLCNIVMEVELLKKLVDTNPMIELTIRQILNVPSYIQKGVAKKDYVCGERLYYLFTDIGKNEAGEVLVDFMRGTGNIYGKVVRKDQTSIDEEANWRSIYRMPSKDWEDSVEYDPFIKKLKVSTEDTADCIEGCYLLISIQIGLTEDYGEDYRFYPFSILTRVNPANGAYTDIPKIVIQMNEYIVGNIARSENERISEFYEIWLPHDAEKVQFDWQSSVAGLYVNLGGIRPTAKNPDFKLLPKGKDSILSLTKEEILNRAKAKGITVPYPGKIQDLSLVIGIWTEKSDSLDTEVFSLRVHLPLGENQLDITEVVGDHKTMCKATFVEAGQYRCLFMVTMTEQQLIKGIIAHGESEDKSAVSYIYGRYIEKQMFDEFDQAKLSNNIPTSQSSEFNSKNDGVDYIYTKVVDQSKYLFISVITDKEADVSLLVSFYTFNYILSPNPSGEQIFSVTDSHLNLDFASRKDLMINIVTLGGEGEIYWANNKDTKYILRGRGDRLSLTSGRDYTDFSMGNLVIENTKKSGKTTNMDDPGFAFYISYQTRDPAHNVDEILPGRSLEMAYRDTDFPVFLFSKVLDSAHDVNVALTFKNFDDKSQTKRTYFEKPLFKFTSSLVKEATAYQAKANADIIPLSEKSLVGTFDLAVATGFLGFTSDDLMNFNIKDADNPTLYIQIEKTDPSVEIPNFSLEAQVSKNNDMVPAIEKVYNYGRISPSTRVNSFKLRVDKNYKMMRVIYASNGDLEFYLSERMNTRTSIAAEKKTEAGKTTLTFTTSVTQDFYYLNIFKKDNSKADARLNNYVFKYINAKSEEGFKEYPIKKDPQVVYSENQNSDNTTNITVVINKIATENVNITYFLKVVSNSTHVYGEQYNTIALAESPAVVVANKNPKPNADDTITLTAYNVPKDYVYINVIAQILDETIVEYNAYTGIHVKRPYIPPEGSEGGVDTVVFLVVGGVLLLLVIGLVVAVIIFKNRNKSLLNQVKHVSFQKTNSNTDPNLLLNKQQQQQAAENPQPPAEANE